MVSILGGICIAALTVIGMKQIGFGDFTIGAAIVSMGIIFGGLWVANALHGDFAGHLRRLALWLTEDPASRSHALIRPKRTYKSPPRDRRNPRSV